MTVGDRVTVNRHVTVGGRQPIQAGSVGTVVRVFPAGPVRVRVDGGGEATLLPAAIDQLTEARA